METEFEARFLEIDTEAVRTTLAGQGGACVMPRTRGSPCTTPDFS